MVITLAARASRIENQDAIDAAIVGMLADPKEVRILYLFLQISGLLLASPRNWHVIFNNSSISCMK